MEIIRDSELVEKTALFKEVGEQDEHWGEYYEGENE